MGLAKKMDWLRWIRKYSGILQDPKTGSTETLIDSVSSKNINYAYTSSVIDDDESINVAAPPHQRPMLPPPNTSQESPALPQLPNDVYDCCVSLDGIPIKHEFQYTLSNTNGCGKVAKHDIEGLASKILESMYGTTLKTSKQGQRTVKVTLNIRQSTGVQVDCTTATMTPSWGHHNNGRERKHKSSSDRRHHAKARMLAESEPAESDCLIYGFNGLPMHYKLKSGAELYRRDQLVEMVEKSLAENLSFQSLKEAQNRPEGYHRTRTRRRQSSASAGGALQQHAAAAAAAPSPAAKPTKPQPKVAWSPYDFEPVAHVPSHYHHQHHHHNQHQYQYQNERQHRNHKNQQRTLYGKGGGGGGPPVRAAAPVEERGVKLQNGAPRPHRRAAATTAAVVSTDRHQQKPKNLAATTAATAAQEHTKNLDHQRYKRAKMASKKIHHHIHEHHHYHHYDYYIV